MCQTPGSGEKVVSSKNVRPCKCLLALLLIIAIIIIVGGASLLWYFLGEQRIMGKEVLDMCLIAMHI